MAFPLTNGSKESAEPRSSGARPPALLSRPRLAVHQPLLRACWCVLQHPGLEPLQSTCQRGNEPITANRYPLPRLSQKLAVDHNYNSTTNPMEVQSQVLSHFSNPCGQDVRPALGGKARGFKLQNASMLHGHCEELN